MISRLVYRKHYFSVLSFFDFFISCHLLGQLLLFPVFTDYHSASGEQIMDIFDQLNADGASILMITHEQAVADRAQKTYHLRDGRLGP